MQWLQSDYQRTTRGETRIGIEQAKDITDIYLSMKLYAKSRYCIIILSTPPPLAVIITAFLALLQPFSYSMLDCIGHWIVFKVHIS